MPLRKEIIQQMKNAGILSFEIKEFSNARTPSGDFQDLDKVTSSKPFEEMLNTRRLWFKTALTPKSLGGWGLKYEECVQLIRNHYAMTKKRHTKRSIFDFLKQSYKNKDKITSPRAFRDAIIKKSIITRDLGKYGQKLKLRYYPRHYPRCRWCGGTGTRINLEGHVQDCLHCGGSGVSNR